MGVCMKLCDQEVFLKNFSVEKHCICLRKYQKYAAGNLTRLNCMGDKLGRLICQVIDRKGTIHWILYKKVTFNKGTKTIKNITFNKKG